MTDEWDEERKVIEAAGRRGTPADYDFSLIARRRWPAALDEIERLRAENAELHERLEEYEGRALEPAIPER